MSKQVWFTSDLHLFHTNMLQGGKIGIRPFDTINEMHERIIDGWNSVVKPTDKIYMLGDLTLRRSEAHWPSVADIVLRLNGQKRLILGNHDHFPLKDYMLMGFEKVLAMRTFDDYIITHVPVHPCQFGRFKGNVHGHLHEQVVEHTRTPLYGAGFVVERTQDTRYLNVCVEQLDYTPIAFEEAKKRMAQ